MSDDLNLYSNERDSLEYLQPVNARLYIDNLDASSQSPHSYGQRSVYSRTLCPLPERKPGFSRSNRATSLSHSLLIHMNFTDSQLKKYYESTLEETTDISFVMRQVGAMINTHDYFQILEGPHSARVHVTVQYLLFPEMHLGLRRRYLRTNAYTYASALEFLEQLGRMAVEQFGDDMGESDVSTLRRYICLIDGDADEGSQWYKFKSLDGVLTVVAKT